MRRCTGSLVGNLCALISLAEADPLLALFEVALLNAEAVFPGLTSGACACHRFAIYRISQLQNSRCG